MVKGVINTVKKYPKLSALGGLAATAGPIPAAIGAAGYGAYKHRDAIGKGVSKGIGAIKKFGGKVVDTVKKHPKTAALAGLAATAGPIPAALAAGGYGVYKGVHKLHQRRQQRLRKEGEKAKQQYLNGMEKKKITAREGSKVLRYKAEDRDKIWGKKGIPR